MNNKKSKIGLYLCIAIFGVLGVYLTFFASNTSKYDGKAKAYRIEPNESYDSDGGVIYRPTYYFKIRGREYVCKSSGGSSSYPNMNKNIVFYDSKNPEKCVTEYSASNSKVGGIICLIATALMAFFFIIKKPTNNTETYGENYYQEPAISPETQQKIEENAAKSIEVVDKIQLVIKRVIIGFIIFVLLILILIDTLLYKQTQKAKDYIDTTAKLVGKKEVSESDIFDDYTYTFVDKQGKEQEITIGVSKGEEPSEEINIKYDEKNPQEFYEDGATLDKTDMTWYIVKIVAVVLLIFLFFNKKLLSKIGISVSNRTY